MDIDPFWLHVGSIWAPFGLLLGSFWPPFGTLWVPFWLNVSFFWERLMCLFAPLSAKYPQKNKTNLHQRKHVSSSCSGVVNWGLCLNPFINVVLYGMCLKPLREEPQKTLGRQRPGKCSKRPQVTRKSDTSGPPVNIAKMDLKAPLAAWGQETAPNDPN